MSFASSESDQPISQLRPAQILAAAQGLFVAGGFDATSMDKVARAAGVSKRTPYIYFENKHDLFSAVVLGFLRELEDRLDVVWRGRTGADAITVGLRVYADYALAHPAHFDLIMTFERRDFYPGREMPPAGHAAECQAVNDRMTVGLVSAVEQAIAAKSISTDLTPGQYGLLFWSSLTGVLTIALERQNVLGAAYGWNTRQMVDAFISHTLSSPH